MDKAFEVLNQGGPVGFVTGKLNELQQRRTELSRGIDAKSAEQQDIQSREARYRHSKAEIKQLVDRLQSPATEELFKLRAQIASQLKVLVHTLSIGSVGIKPRLLASIDRLRRSPDPRAEAAIAHMSLAAAHPYRSRRYFTVGFRDSNVRSVFPNDDDPLRFQQQIVASELSGFEILRPDGVIPSS
jgi:hypothetical protein